MNREEWVWLRSSDWWLARRAKRLGITVGELRHIIRVAGSLESRRQHQVRCFTCGYKVHDTDKTDDPIREYFVIRHEDEDEIVCSQCITPEMMAYAEPGGLDD